jgi:4'-phosphopantetheinyl transferase EntD
LITAALTDLAPPGVLTGHRRITAGDENELLAGELDGFHRTALVVRRRSGAARIAARLLLTSLGVEAAALPRTPEGPAAWPSDMLGSLAHDEEIAVAAVARAGIYAGIGIDVEPAQPLPPELIDRVATPAERRRYDPAVLATRRLFCAKEAVYKAQYPCDRTFLDFHDIEVDLERNQAVTRAGRVIQVVVTTTPRVLALAFIPAPRR